MCYGMMQIHRHGIILVLDYDDFSVEISREIVFFVVVVVVLGSDH